MRLARLPSFKTRPRLRRLLLWLLFPLLLLMAGCRLMTNYMVTLEDRNAPRHPDGVRVGYEERTLGPADSPDAVLFVHGWIGATSNFADLPDRLATRGWRVRLMRLPGHGTSPRDFEKTTPEELIAAVRGELADLKKSHKRVALVGHSMGGTLATIAAARDGADALVLGAPYFGVTYHWFYVMRVETWTRLFSPFVRWIYKGKLFIKVQDKDAKKNIESYTWFPSRGAVTLNEMGRRANEPDILKGLACPVLLLHSRADSAAAAGRAEHAFNQMPSKDKRVVWLPNSDHHIFWDHDRELVAGEVERFLEAIRPK